MKNTVSKKAPLDHIRRTMRIKRNISVRSSGAFIIVLIFIADYYMPRKLSQACEYFL